MAGCGYTIFDTAVGRCGIAWGDSGIVGVQLPEEREIETRRRMLRQYPDARELRPPLNVEMAIDGIAALLRGEGADLSGITLDLSGIPDFNVRVYAFTRTIRRGETRTYGEVAAGIRASGAVRSVAQAIARNPFVIIVPCHRVLRSRRLRRQDFAERRQHLQAAAALDRGRRQFQQQDPVRRASPGCAGPPADLNLRYGRNHPLAAPIHLGVPVPLQRRTG
jgi:methylated-DNA-[protein]-cysteine S-methyltransferase